MTEEYSTDDLQDLISPTSTEEAEIAMQAKPTKTQTLYNKIVKENTRSVSADPSYYDKHGCEEQDEQNIVRSFSVSTKQTMKMNDLRDQRRGSAFARMLQSDNDED